MIMWQESLRSQTSRWSRFYQGEQSVNRQKKTKQKKQEQHMDYYCFHGIKMALHWGRYDFCFQRLVCKCVQRGEGKHVTRADRCVNQEVTFDKKKKIKNPSLDLWPQRGAHTAGNASHDVTSTFIIHAYIPHGTSRAHWLFIHKRNIWPWNTRGYENLFFLSPITLTWWARAYICKATCAYNIYDKPTMQARCIFICVFFFLKQGN